MAEKPNYIMCKEQILRATLEITLTEGACYVLVTRDKSAYGTFNRNITGTPQIGVLTAEKTSQLVPLTYRTTNHAT